MMQVPLISVIMPAYNHEKYVEDCVRSVLAQDWPRIELIVIDDGSKDSTFGILQRLKPECEARLERVVFETQENHGECYTLNRLASMVHGDFVAMLDSDDQYLPGAFSALVKPFLADSDVGLVVGQNEIMDSDGRKCFWGTDREVVYDADKARYRTFNEYLCHKNRLLENDGVYGTYAAMVRGNHIPNGQMIRKAFYDRALPYHVEAPIDDFWLHLQMTKFSKYVAIPEYTYLYRWHDNNTVAREEYMSRCSYLTYRYEYERLLSSGNKRFLAVFDAETNRRERIFGIGRIFALMKVRTLEEKRTELMFLGFKMVVKRRILSKV